MVTEKKLEIILHRSAVIKDIQDQFRVAYPFLKIEFYSKDNTRLAAKTNFPLPDLPVTINMHPAITVSEFENNILSLTGIRVKVLRKAGNLWIPAFLTHDWTLEKQNLEGEQMSHKMIE